MGVDSDHNNNPWNAEPSQSSENTPHSLRTLREKIATFCTVSCRLIHEQVIEITDSDYSGEEELDKLMVKRKGFCNRDQRKKFLGCAHTRANDEFIHLADEVYITGLFKTENPPSVTLKDIFMKIYILDQEKGALEKRYAYAKKISLSTNEINQIKNAVEVIEQKHHCLIDELEVFRQSFLSQLDFAIAKLAV